MSIEQGDGAILETLHPQHFVETWTDRDTELYPSSRKRKREGIESSACARLVEDSIIIEAHPSFPHAHTQRLAIRLLLPRLRIPLAYLNPHDGVEELLGPTLFKLRIEDLRKVEALHTPQSILLIVQSGEDECLYAIENVHGDIYAICKLGQWVDLRTLNNLRVAQSRPPSSPQRPYKGLDVISNGPWWGPAAVHADAISCPKAASVYALRLSFAKCSQSKSRWGSVPAPARALDVHQPDSTISFMSKHEVEIVDHQKDFEAIRNQYQEALYASKASLAYFAKGPLSRARANTTSLSESKSDFSRLVYFLRSSILPLPSMDRKYRETLPSIVRDLPFRLLSEDESAAVLAMTIKKASRKKNNNIGKNGLFSGEEANIARWWLSRDMADVTCDTDDAREGNLRTALLDQKFRETQLQVILVLETLALEASVSIMPSQEHSIIQISELPRNDPEGKPKKQKRPQDLNVLLDLLVDRLSIWQSMESEDDQTSKDYKSASHRSKGHGNGNLKLDNLRQFGLDVVLPFYGARLPEKSTLLCQKFGGLKEPSPKRPPKARVLSSSRPAAKPGLNPLRRQLRKPKQTLERVMTDELSTFRRFPPSLSRSATEPVLPQLKRETSDVSLSTIPINKVALSKRYSQREVDLHCASQATEFKQKKKASIEQELQGAIAALKKPNPRLAVKEFIEAAEKRVSGSHPRKSKNHVRNPFAPGVQVMATPSKNRQQHMFASLREEEARPVELEEIPPSSISRIPSSAAKDRGVIASDLQEPESSNRFDFPAVDQTPTKRPLKFFKHPAQLSVMKQQTSKFSESCLQRPEPLLVPTVSSSKPKRLSTEQNMLLTPSGRSATACEKSPKTSSLQMTPMRIVDTSMPAAESIAHSSHEEEINIYSSLNWDNDYDDII